MKPLNITVTDLTLDTVIGGSEYVIDGEDEGYEPVTLLDVIVKAVVSKLLLSTDGRAISHDVKERVARIRDEEIRTRVVAEVEQVLAEPFRAANSFGEPRGEPRTMRTVIAEKVNDFFTKNIDDGYNRPRKTLADTFIEKAVNEALVKELAAAIADEKAKVVAAVRAKAAELIATAVREGVGR